MANISRRNFMKVAAGAAGIAGLGLLNGCSKTEAPASSAAASAAGSAAEGTTTPAAAAPASPKLWQRAAPMNIPRKVTAESEEPCPASTSCLSGHPPASTAANPTTYIPSIFHKCCAWATG